LDTHAQNTSTRRGALRMLAFTTAGTALAVGFSHALAAVPAVRARANQAIDYVLEPLDAQVRPMLEQRLVPGVAVGLLIDGQPHAAGWGVTNVDYPRPVDADTVFQIGSATKPFTGGALAILASQGRVDFEAPVRTYIPELELGDREVAEQMTVRHLVTHSSGFLGEEVPDGGRGDDALSRLVPRLAAAQQLAPLGRMFSYNNAAVALAGRVIEIATNRPYEDAIQELLLAPLGMQRSSFFLGDLLSYQVAAGHVPGINGLQPERPYGSGLLTRAVAPTGGLLSTANDLLLWASFQLGDGRAEDGTRVLSREALALTHARLGPGGAMSTDDFDGVGVNWLLRQMNGTRIVEHSGTTPGHRARVVLVPDRRFAFVMLTNAVGGSAIRKDLTNWALDHYLGLRESPPTAIRLAASYLGEFIGAYGVRGVITAARIARAGDLLAFEPAGEDGSPQAPPAPLAFYAPDRAIVTDGPLQDNRVDFLRDEMGDVGWLRFAGRALNRL
jgi:CubicO group peptidase (beta-lactamase class C family)